MCGWFRQPIPSAITTDFRKVQIKAKKKKKFASSVKVLSAQHLLQIERMHTNA